MRVEPREDEAEIAENLSSWFGMTPNEAEAWVRCDPDACARFEEFVRDRIWAYVKWRLPRKRGWEKPSDADAHEIVQLTRIKLYGSGYDSSRGPLRPWAYRIAEQQSVTFFASERRHRTGRVDDPDAAENAKLCLQGPEAGEDTSKLICAFVEAAREAVGDVPANGREALEVWLEDGDYHALAEQAGITPSTAAVRLSRGKAALSRLLAVRGYRVWERGVPLPDGAVIVALLGSTLMLIFIPTGGSQ